MGRQPERAREPEDLPDVILGKAFADRGTKGPTRVSVLMLNRTPGFPDDMESRVFLVPEERNE